MRRVHVGKMELNGSTPQRGVRRAKNGIIVEKTHFSNIICPSVLHNRCFQQSMWLGRILLPLLHFSCFPLFRSTISPLCSSTVPQLPGSHPSQHLGNIRFWKNATEESTWQWLDASDCGAAALTLAPDRRGQLTPNRQAHAPSVIDSQGWNDEPRLIFPSSNHLSSSFTFICSSVHMWARFPSSSRRLSAHSNSKPEVMKTYTYCKSHTCPATREPYDGVVFIYIRVVETQASTTEIPQDFLTYQVNLRFPAREERKPGHSWPWRTGSQHPLFRLMCICGQKCYKATSGTLMKAKGSLRVTRWGTFP